MISGWAAALVTLAYICALFAIAHYGDTRGGWLVRGRMSPVIYALGLCVYCTSWTFLGSVGLASVNGLQFLPIYVGPILVFIFGRRLLLRLVRLAKAENINSVADFVAARFGKADTVAICVTIICVLGCVPYIALQLKAIVASLAVVLGSLSAGQLVAATPSPQTSIIAAIVLAGFAMVFGTRRVDATEHQDGLMLAVATESLVKLAAFLAVGVFITYSVYDGLGDLFVRVEKQESIRAVFAAAPNWPQLITTTILSAFAVLLLPRQFHVTFVENRHERDLATSGWVFPVYLVAINIFVLPLVVAGLLAFPNGTIDRDLTVLALPLHAGVGWLAVFAMIGGLSAATAMVVVETVALSIMVSNDLVLPLALRRQQALRPAVPGDIGLRILVVRRVAILVMLGLGYLYLRVAGDAALASIGLISFACIAQIAPAFFGGLLWSRATAPGAVAGLISGTLVWAYTLLLPSFDLPWAAFDAMLDNGPFGIEWLRPAALFGLDLPPLVHGSLVSLCANVIAFAGVSLWRIPTRIERLQAATFVRPPAPRAPGGFRLWRSSITVGELEATVARYLGSERAHGSFREFLSSRGLPLERAREADVDLLRHAEHLLASAIGAASSRLVLSLVLRRRNVPHKAALQLVDEASAAIQYNRDLFQYALDFTRQGITVFDREMRLICWNREFRELFDLPADVLRVGVEVEAIVRYNASRGLYGPGAVEADIIARIDTLMHETDPVRLKLSPSGRVLEVRSAHMPDGSVVTTYTDISDQVLAEEVLEATNETLERRVRERTEELVKLNIALASAKAQAEDANVSKTRFLAAASHDILQPLNAARLYASSLSEKLPAADVSRDLASNVDASLEAVEDILTTLLDISRLDAGAMKPELSAFRLSDILQPLQKDFEPLARERGISLTFVPTRAIIHSDRRLLRRLVQNYVSNAIKYTASGRVLVGVRRVGGQARIEVWDTGLGIPSDKRREIFLEFERLEAAQRTAKGVGLGLSIVERLARVLDHEIGLRSEQGRGSTFWVKTPLAQSVSADANVEIANIARAPSSFDADFVICVIDNEPRILDGMMRLMSGWGCTIVTAIDGIEAIARLNAAGLVPCAIVADYHLDSSTGLDAIAALRACFGGMIPGVLVTADRSTEVRAAAYAADIGMLAKPLRPAALRAMLAQWRVSREAAE